MPKPNNYIQEVGEIAKAFERLGLTPVLVGGMALVILGSRRVTRDFDIVISNPRDQLKDMVDYLYGRGFELASQVDANEDITTTIDNATVAAIRLRMDSPDSVFFINSKTGLRIDLLFDFPIPATELATNAKKIKVSSKSITVASDTDLLRLKKIAKASRSSPNDDQDIAFLEAHQKKQTQE